jgi:hypothetical protein
MGGHPPTFPFEMPGVYDSDTILNLDRMPESLAADWFQGIKLEIVSLKFGSFSLPRLPQ